MKVWSKFVCHNQLLHFQVIYLKMNLQHLQRCATESSTRKERFFEDHRRVGEHTVFIYQLRHRKVNISKIIWIWKHVIIHASIKPQILIMTFYFSSDSLSRWNRTNVEAFSTPSTYFFWRSNIPSKSSWSYYKCHKRDRPR